MTQAQYNLWLSVWNQGILAGLSSYDALVNADKAVQKLFNTGE